MLLKVGADGLLGYNLLGAFFYLSYVGWGCVSLVVIIQVVVHGK